MHLAKSVKPNPTDTKELGLVVGLQILKNVLGTDYLHYGWWDGGMEVHCINLGKAQQVYAEYLFDLIPQGTQRILDVGCGSGRTAVELVSRGYNVECISPAQYLTEHARALLADSATVHHGKFEDVEPGTTFDLILFSESFQYIALEHSLPKARRLLNPGGSILICDFFRQDDVEGHSPIGGGHGLRDFWHAVDRNGLTVAFQEDITKYVAPTVDVYNTVTMQVVQPVYYGLRGLLQERFSLLAKLIFWKYRKKLEKIETKHFAGSRTAENFAKYKRYLAVLLKV